MGVCVCANISIKEKKPTGSGRKRIQARDGPFAKRSRERENGIITRKSAKRERKRNFAQDLCVCVCECVEDINEKKSSRGSANFKGKNFEGWRHVIFF